MIKIIPKKELGQHFIKDVNILKREIKYAKIGKNDTVLEIGSGIGNLTELLAQKTKKVIAIEKDKQFKDCLDDLQRKYNNLKIIWGDVLTVNIPYFNKVVSNLPFKIALPLTFKLLEYDFDLGILIYQKRLAKRLCAFPGQKGYSRITVQVRRVANVKILELIKKTSFYPSPKVDCAIVKIKKTKPKFDISSEDFFKRTLDFMFFKRTKTVRQVLPILKLKHLQNKRIHQLTPKQFGIIAGVLHEKNIKIPAISNEIKRKAQKFK